MLSDEARTRIKTTAQPLIAAPSSFGAAFYDNLFDAAPSLRPMFKPVMVEQSSKLALFLIAIVQNIDRLETMVPVLQDLGARHHGYGAQTAHYDMIGLVLVETLSQSVPNWSDADAQAWMALYELAAGIMIDAADRDHATA